jgi:hypothetical protein
VWENKMFSEYSDLRTMNSNIRITATQCSLGTWFVSGICVDTHHKRDIDDIIVIIIIWEITLHMPRIVAKE